MPLWHEITTAIRWEAFQDHPRWWHSAKRLRRPLWFCTERCQRGAAHPAVKNAIRKKQSSYIFHYLYEWRRRSPVEENKMTAHTQWDWWRHQISDFRDIAIVLRWAAVVYRKDFINKLKMCDWPVFFSLKLSRDGCMWPVRSPASVTGDLSRKGIIRLFFTFGFGWHFLVSVR